MVKNNRQLKVVQDGSGWVGSRESYAWLRNFIWLPCRRRHNATDCLITPIIKILFRSYSYVCTGLHVDQNIPLVQCYNDDDDDDDDASVVL